MPAESLRFDVVAGDVVIGWSELEYGIDYVIYEHYFAHHEKAYEERFK